MSYIVLIIHENMYGIGYITYSIDYIHDALRHT